MACASTPILPEREPHLHKGEDESSERRSTTLLYVLCFGSMGVYILILQPRHGLTASSTGVLVTPGLSIMASLLEGVTIPAGDGASAVVLALMARAPSH